MPNVIINTSPMQYLYQVNLLSLLPKLYGEIIVPQSVEYGIIGYFYCLFINPKLPLGFSSW